MKIFKNQLFIYIMLLFGLNSCTPSFSVMSYNIKNDKEKGKENDWETRKRAMVGLLRYYKPQIVGIQEAYVNQLEFLNQQLPDYTYVGVGRDNGIKKGEYCPIFFDTTAFNLINHSTFWLAPQSKKISRGWDAALARICTYALLENKKTGEALWVFNTHFDHQGKRARVKSAELIVRRIKELNQKGFPVIVMGDLNCLPESAPVQLFKRNKLRDAHSIARQKMLPSEGTYNAFRKDKELKKRIDYVFVDGLKVMSYQHIANRIENGQFISDHYPVFVKLKVK